MKGVAQNKNALLVTDTERIAALYELLGSRFSNRGQLLIPTLRQYEALNTDEGLLALAKDFCRWLGIKPHVLHVSYTTQSQYSKVSTDTILINNAFREHPLTAAGILALATLRFVFEHKHFTADERFIEVASIETGLGLWVMNAFPHVRSRRERLYHMLDGAWLQLEGFQPKAMTTAEYIRDFTVFTMQNRLFPEDYSKGISQRNHYVIPIHPSGVPLTFLPEPTVTIAHMKKANALWIRITLIALIISTVIAFGIFLWTNHLQPTPLAQRTSEQSLQVIKESLNTCIHKATEQQNSYDPNDLFMTRQIDATKSRCESLRNQYNTELDGYQKTYLR